MWTRLPVIRLLGLWLIGILIHVAVFAGLFGSTLAIAYATGIYENLVWPESASSLWIWFIFGCVGAPFLIGVGVWGVVELTAQEKMQTKDILVICHVTLMIYWVFRCAFCLCMMLTTSWLGAAFLVTLELDLFGAALGLAAIAGIGYCFYLIPRACIRRCKQELASDKDLK